jgi:small-conductance mechanosensitive channel
MKSLLGSRKFIVAVVSLAAMVLGAVAGVDVTPETVEVGVQLVCAWLIAQGIADAGSGGTTRSE